MSIQVGDRVRVVKNYYEGVPQLNVGAVGVVGLVNEEGYDFKSGKTVRAVGVFIDGHPDPIFNAGGWGYPEDYVEVIV